MIRQRYYNKIAFVETMPLMVPQLIS